MVKQRKSRCSEKDESLSESHAALNKRVVSNAERNGNLEGAEHSDNDMAENGICDQPSSKKKKSCTLGQLAEQQRIVRDEELPHPSGVSLAVQMTQGLMSNDILKLDSVLRESKLEIIQATLTDLQVAHIVPLLKALFERISNRSATNVRPWILWIQCILSLHISYLVSLRNLETELSGLLEWMRQRVGHQQKLLELYGRLSVIGEQIERKSNRTVVVAPQPLIVFNDDVDSDNEELESGGSEESGASSDEEEEDWWEEQGIGASDENSSEDSDDNSDQDVLLKKSRGINEDSGANGGDELEMESDDGISGEDEGEEMDIG